VSKQTPTAAKPSQAKKKVLLVDDHALMRQGLELLINQQPDLEVCAQAETVHQAMDAIKAHPPDIVVTDITLRKRAEQALVDREAHFRALTEHSGDLVCVFDGQGLAKYESPSYARLLGHSLADTQVNGVWAAVHPDDRDMLRALMRTLVAGEEQSVQCEFRVTGVSGAWHTLETVAVSRLADPVVQGIIATSRDISQRKAAEAALAENEARLRATYRALACGVFVIDPTGAVLEANTAMHAILGLPDGSCRGQRLNDLHGFTLIGDADCIHLARLLNCSLNMVKKFTRVVGSC